MTAALTGFVLTMAATVVFAEDGGSVSWTMNIIGLFGGLAFFLFGMELMSLGMKNAAGNKLRGILAALTGNRFRALALGFVVTLIIQSGGATSVMLVGFVQAGLMAFSQTIGVLIGAGIGKTVTIQLIAFKVTDYALLFIRGERPVMDKKYDILKHPYIKLTEDGGAAPYVHHPGLTYAQADLSVPFESLDYIEILE